jgi:hypothetical protein
MEDRLMFEDSLVEHEQTDLITRWFAEPVPYVISRFIFLRALGLIFFSAFLSLYFQIHGLIGANGILPVASYLTAAKSAVGIRAYWYVPSLLWINASDTALSVLVWTGFVASVAIVLNIFPRLAIATAGVGGGVFFFVLAGVSFYIYIIRQS